MELILAEDILAKQEKHQRTVRRTTRILYGVFLLAFAAVVTALFFFAQIEPPFGTAPATAIFPLLLACYLITLSATLVTIAIHELGHLVAAWMVNYYVALILIGPFALARTNTGWRWRVGTDGKLGGAVLAGPLDAHDLRRRHLWVIAGGPLASWLWYILLLILSWTLKPSPGLHWPTLILDGFVLWAGLACWLNLLPYQIGHIPNDSWQLLALWRKDPQFLLHLRLNRLATQSLAGARPRALDSTTLDELIEKLAPKHGAAQAAVVAFYHALDSGDHEAANRYLHKALGATTHTPTPPLVLAVSYYHATFAKDAVQARRWLDYYDACFGGVPNSFSALIATELHQTYTHVEATIRQLEGDHISAQKAARQSLQLLANSIERGDAQWLTPHLQALLNEPASTTAPTDEQHPPTERQLINPAQPRHITRALQVFSPGAMLLAFILLCISGWPFGALIPMTWYGNMAGRHYDQGEWAEAVADYSHAIALMPTEPRLYWRRGNSYLGLHEYDGALNDYHRAVILAEADRDATLLEALYYRGNGYLTMRDWDRGQQDLEQVLQLSATSREDARWREALHKTYYQQGTAAYEEGAYAFALLALDAAVVLDEEQARSYWYRGAAHASLHDYPAAVADYSKAISALGAEKPSLYQFRGDAYMQMGKYAAAHADYDLFLATADEITGQHLYTRGLLHFQLGDYRAALEDWMVAEAAGVDEPLLPIYRALAYAGLHEFGAAQVAFENGRSQQHVWELYRLVWMARMAGIIPPLTAQSRLREQPSFGVTQEQITLSLRFATQYAIPAIVSH